MKHLRRRAAWPQEFNPICAAVADGPEINLVGNQKHTPRSLRGVRVIQRIFALPNSWKSATLSLAEFTIQFLAKTQTL
jgi:hypothetical protein